MTPSISYQLRTIRRRANKLRSASDEMLREASLGVKYRRSCRPKSNRSMLDSLPIAVEAARRSIGLQFHDVQILAGIQLCHGKIVEMKTGEGKTLTALLPIYYHALTDQGVHVVTVNDYLAQRDLKYLRPAFDLLGISGASIVGDSTPDQRRTAYQADVTYASGKEFGFDFLRDRMQSDPSHRVQRELNFALVDEADSVMLDEARTPLIIGVPSETGGDSRTLAFHWAAQHADRFSEELHFQYKHQQQTVELLPTGKLLARELSLKQPGLTGSLPRLFQTMQNAIKVRRDFSLDKNYALVEEKVVIIDEFTGRPAEGRQWQQGIHQAVEAKEGIAISPDTKTAATITMQAFLKRYRALAGMTGTAWTSRRELKVVYKKSVVRIPTDRPTRRSQYPTLIAATFDQKLQLIALETAAILRAGRAILIGTRSVEKSESVSSVLARLNIEHQVLNARFVEQESEIIALAGQTGKVTVATNMAGRGTDIQLDDSVRAAGGLHVVLTEIHDSQRIDWQLIGRCSRQGDPGSFRIFLGADDEILTTAFGPQRAAKIRSRLQKESTISPRRERIFRLAQLKIEYRQLVDRKILTRQDLDRQKQAFSSGIDPFLDTIY